MLCILDRKIYFLVMVPNSWSIFLLTWSVRHFAVWVMFILRSPSPSLSPSLPPLLPLFSQPHLNKRS